MFLVSLFLYLRSVFSGLFIYYKIIRLCSHQALIIEPKNAYKHFLKP